MGLKKCTFFSLTQLTHSYSTSSKASVKRSVLDLIILGGRHAHWHTHTEKIRHLSILAAPSHWAPPANTQKLLSNFLLALSGDFISLELWTTPAMSVPPGLHTLSPKAPVSSHIEK